LIVVTRHMQTNAAKIDEEIHPIPVRREWRPLLEALEVGQSLSAELDDEGHNANRLRYAASTYSGLSGKKFRVAKITAEKVVRCWRVS